jgi:poly-gamma-glutamate capsule biosynthesis protein CapA/YwtB (metallophosphatase superfamily)
VADYDRDAADRRRSDRQRAARAARRRRWLVSGGIALATVVTVGGIVYGGWRLVADSARSAAIEPPAPAAVATASVEPTPAVEPTPSVPATGTVQPPVSPTITVIGVGDLMFSMGPTSLMKSQGNAAPLAKVADVLKGADITIANLESPLSRRGTAVKGKPAHLIFEAPPEAVQSLTAAGIDIVAMANNHMMDYGAPAMEDTLGTLDAAGILHSGGGMNRDDAWKPAIIERNGKKVAYLSFTQRIPSYFMPTATTPGIASGNDMKAVRKAIQAAKKQADYVIVSFHWGVEQSYQANASQIRDGRAAVDAGADMVLSHHPHVMQGVEFYKGRLIAYSLGNFLFAYKTTEGRKSFILKASLGPDGVTDVSAVPVYLGQWGRPVVQTGSSARSILGKLRDISAPRGTRVVIEGDTARIVPE